MNDIFKTLMFVGISAGLATVAALSFYNKPVASENFELIGQPFFDDFKSANQAKSLEVIAFEKDGEQVRRFSVRQENGLWVIPSHNNYPAEAIERLARTAVSLIGVEREALAGRLKSEHERLGVVDPLDEALEDPQHAGQRITLKDENDEVLVDLIIGKEVEDDTGLENDDDIESIRMRPRKSYYVRRGDEDPTYKVELDIDLSTRFVDWIETDLLQINNTDVSSLIIDNYTLQEARTVSGVTLVKSQEDKINLIKPTSGNWEIEDLEARTEKLKTAEVSQLVTALDELSIVGVRPKFKYKDHLLLTADLKLNQRPEFNEDKQGFALAIREMQADLQAKGFNLAAGPQGDTQLVSLNGDIKLGTNDGIQYTLSFGQPVSGTEDEIEIGGARDKASDESEKSGSDSDLDDDADSAAADSAEPSDASDAPSTDQSPATGEDVKNRYIMVRVSFEESLVANRPTKPVQPEMPDRPADYVPAKSQPEANPSEKDAAAAPQPTEKSGGNSDQPPADVDAPPGASTEPQERRPVDIAYDALVKEYDQKMIEYNLALEKYEQQMKEFQVRVDAGKKRVSELNDRFGDWYYVISGDNLKALKVSRKDLIDIKSPQAPQQAPPGANGNAPQMSFPKIPGLNVPANPPSTDKPDAGEMQTDPPKTVPATTVPPKKPDGQPGADAKPARDAKPAEPKGLAKPAGNSEPDRKPKKVSPEPVKQSGGGPDKSTTPKGPSSERPGTSKEKPAKTPNSSQASGGSDKPKQVDEPEKTANDKLSAKPDSKPADPTKKATEGSEKE